METTNPAGEVAQDPIAAIAGILDREEREASPEVEQEEEVQSAPELEADTTEATDTQEGETDGDEWEEVEYDGEQYNLPKKLKDAVLRQADYTRKTQEVAEQRRLVEAHQETLKAQEAAFREEQAFNQVALQDVAEIKAIESTVKQYEAIDWNGLSDSDPVQAQKLWFQFQQQRQKMAEMQTGLQTKFQQFQNAKQQHLQEAMTKAVETLKKDIPNWSPETAKELREAGKANYGFTDTELANVYDPRFVKLLADAAAYRKLQSAKPEINKRVATVPKSVKPGAQQTNQARKQEAFKESYGRLKKSGKVEDAASVIAKLM